MLLFTTMPLAASAATLDEVAQPVGASSGTTGDCTWTLDDEGTLTISGNGAMGDYKEKNTNGTYITAPWGTNIKAVVIEDGVTSIGNYAFRSCTCLTSVTIGNSVTSIGEYAFYGCTGLTSVTIGNSVTSIGYEAFHGCTGLTSVIIPDSVTSIENRSFGYVGNFEDKIDGFTIYGVPGSAAEQYANDNGFTFIERKQAVIGDVDSDGKINVSDLTMIQRHLAGFEILTGERLDLADTNGDGKVTIDDATLLQMFLAEYDVQLG